MHIYIVTFIIIAIMSLSSFFEKRGKKAGQEQTLSTLFSQKESSKFKELKQEVNVSNVVYLQPLAKPQEPQNLQATVFVGNIPLNFKQKEMRNLFKQYGRIQKIWFRSIPVEQNKLGKKANSILKKYSEGADSMNGYVRFVEKREAESACRVNGVKVDDEHTLRVFLCLDDNLDYQTSIFIGNLPLDVREEQLRTHFAPIGEIINVRVIRDKYTFKGLGIGYVRFANKQDMFNAIQSMNGSLLRERPLRVKRAIEKSKLQKKFNRLNEKKLNRKGYTAPQQSSSRVFGNDEEQKKREDARKFHFKRKMIKK